MIIPFTERNTPYLDDYRPLCGKLHLSAWEPMVGYPLERKAPCPASPFRPSTMSRDASKPILDAVRKQLGVVPNMFRLIARSPAALQGFTANNGALAKTLDVKTRERIALAVAQVNGCDYCLSGAHLSRPEPGQDHPGRNRAEPRGRLG